MSRRSAKTRPRILFVDDELELLRTIVYHLRMQYEVITCDDVSKAIKLIEKDDFDVVVTDMAMPPSPEEGNVPESRYGLAGLEVIVAVRRKSSRCPVICCSGVLTNELKRLLQADPHTLYLDKASLFIDTLPSLIAKLLQGGAALKPRSFIVHGHDRECILELKDFLQNHLRLPEPVVLADQKSGGKTIIEKFEHYASQIDVVFALFTPDDIGFADAVQRTQVLRARQNVLFELGYFVAKLGRTSGSVFILRKGPVEIASDLSGIIYIDISNGIRAAGEELRRELSEWL